MEERASLRSRWWFQGLGFLGAALLLGIGALVRTMGLAFQALALFLVLAVIWGMISRSLGLLKDGLHTEHLSAPLEKANWPYVLQAIVRGGFWVALGLCVWVALPRVAFGEDASLYTGIALALVAIRILLEVVPWKVPGWGATAMALLAAIGLTVDFFGARSAVPDEGAVVVAPPVRGDWVVLQGGGAPLINHHHVLKQQRWALDMMAVEDGTIVGGEGAKLSDFHTWGQPLFAPAAGKVVSAVDGLDDQEIMSMDPKNPAGNHVIIEMKDGRFALLAHMKKGSVAVKEGDEVTCGQSLGQAGNSGNTTIPHLHFQVSTHIDLFGEETEALPLRFEGADRVRGDEVVGEPAGLRRNDLLKVRAEGFCEP